MFSKVKSTSKHLHRNKKGDIPVGTILLIGAVVIPLIILLVTYKDTVMTWLEGETKNVMVKQPTQPTP